MKNVHIYLTFDGNCEEAFNFYKEVFDGSFESISRFNEMPPQEGMPPLAEEEMERIMHVTLTLGEGLILMGSDTAGGWGPPHQKGNNFSVSVDASSREEADEYFQKMAKGGQVTMPMNQTFWGSYFGMLTDRFGIQWMISYDTLHENN